ncbi:LLM class flavin-dependent oxidoreductase [Streptomyces sp. NPDC004647]|uniref:LLM class flavin-dependent oxidoreductase n=1 Tax=Streptomyces sp. NPDC004647 TaxID=3154671 RepID=UPI0033A2A8C4
MAGCSRLSAKPTSLGVGAQGDFLSSPEESERGATRPIIGVYYPLQPQHPSELAPFGRLVDRGHADRLWLGESLALGTPQVLAHLAGQGITPALGMGVSLMPLHHPYQAAVAARSLAALSGKPLVTVFGTSSPALVTALHSAPYASPLTAAREYLTAVRQLLQSEAADTSGEYVRTRARLPAGLEAPGSRSASGSSGPRWPAWRRTRPTWRSPG